MTALSIVSNIQREAIMTLLLAPVAAERTRKAYRRTGAKYLLSATAAVALCAFGAGTALAAKETAIYSFTGNTDGGFPQGGLVANERGDLFGVTTSGGSGHNGVVFELKKPAKGQTAWTQTTLYAFTGGNDGGVPQAGLMIDGSGNLYGTTYQFGAGGN